jgi:cytoskeletal protein RodZ
MENGSSNLVADEFYLIPFLRRYAEFLELDPASIVAGFLAEAARTDDGPGTAATRGGRSSWWITGVVILTVLGAAVLWLSS